MTELYSTVGSLQNLMFHLGDIFKYLPLILNNAFRAYLIELF